MYVMSTYSYWGPNPNIQRRVVQDVRSLHREAEPLDAAHQRARARYRRITDPVLEPDEGIPSLLDDTPRRRDGEGDRARPIKRDSTTA